MEFNNDEMVRIQFEIPARKVKELERLMSIGQISTRKDLFNNALTVLEWAMKEVKGGRIIASVDEENRRYKQLAMPILSAAASRQPEDIFPDDASALLAEPGAAR